MKAARVNSSWCQWSIKWKMLLWIYKPLLLTLCSIPLSTCFKWNALLMNGRKWSTEPFERECCECEPENKVACWDCRESSSRSAAPVALFTVPLGWWCDDRRGSQLQPEQPSSTGPAFFRWTQVIPIITTPGNVTYMYIN